MEKNHFKERYELRAAALGIGQKELAVALGVSQSRIAEAIRGDVAPAASALRTKIEVKLCEMIDARRAAMVDAVEPIVRDAGYTGPIRVVMPEDLQYLVMEGPFPVGWYNPVAGVVKFFDGLQEEATQAPSVTARAVTAPSRREP